MILQGYIACHTTFTEGEGKQYPYRTATGNQKQMEHVLANRRDVRYLLNAEANHSFEMGGGDAHFKFQSDWKPKRIYGKRNEDANYTKLKHTEEWNWKKYPMKEK